jgi:hypothetical protein
MLGFLHGLEINSLESPESFKGKNTKKCKQDLISCKKERGNSLPQKEVKKELSLHDIAEKLNCLLSKNETYQLQFDEHHRGHLDSTIHIALIFCKPLMNGRLTVESSRRISTAFIQLRYGKISPDAIVFLSSSGNSGDISGASASYVFFRHLSVEYGLNFKNLKMIVQDKCEDIRGNICNLIKTLENVYGVESMSKAHYTLISSDYHLIRLSEIYKHSPRQSILTPLINNNSTWTFLFAAYPFCVSPDPTLAFLGRIRVLANELSIVLVNLNGYANSNELFARENFSRLCEINKKLGTMIRIMFDNRQRSNYGSSSLEISAKQWEILEQNLCSLHEIQTVLTPIFRGESIDRRTLQKVQEVFVNSIRTIKLTVDPDRPIETSEWELQKKK